MDHIVEIVKWISENYLVIANGLLKLFGGIAILVKLTPTLADDNFVKGIIKFLGKITNKQL